jgi:hypothetical protein
MNIERIANSISQPESHILSIGEAVNLLINKSAKNSQDGFMIPSIKLNATLYDFINGQTTLIVLNESVEALLNAAIDIDALISAVANVPNAEPVELAEHEIMPVSDLSINYMAYKLGDAIRGWTDSGDFTQMLEESANFLNISYQIYKNVTILEKHVGSHFKPPISESITDVAYAFDKLLLDSVSTGAIAMRPAVLGGQRKADSEVLPRKKRRWYLQYVVQR